jgi:hypothetical protein
MHMVIAPTPRATPVRANDTALVHLLEAYIETLKAENEILKHRLAAAQARAAQETKEERAVGEKRANTVIAAETETESPIQPHPPKRRWWRRLAG